MGEKTQPKNAENDMNLVWVDLSPFTSDVMGAVQWSRYNTILLAVAWIQTSVLDSNRRGCSRRMEMGRPRFLSFTKHRISATEFSSWICGMAMSW